jgi:hypothetical protein
MLYRLLADLAAFAHFAFVIFVAFGGLLVLRWRKLAWVHLPAAIWGALIEIARWTCPLTPIENFFRNKGGLAGYGDDFIAHYLFGMIYPAGLTRRIELLLAVFVIVINTAVYSRVFSIRRRRSRQL